MCVLLCVFCFPSCTSFQLNQSIKITELFSSFPSSFSSHFGSFCYGRNLKAREHCPLLDVSRNGSEAGGSSAARELNPSLPATTPQRRPTPIKRQGRTDPVLSFRILEEDAFVRAPFGILPVRMILLKIRTQIFERTFVTLIPQTSTARLALK